MSAPVPPETLADIENALVLGRKIDAIKLYRQCSGAGLTEAKEAVERVEAELRATSPERFAAGPRGGVARRGHWCGWVFLALGALHVLTGLGMGLDYLSLSFRSARVEGTVVEMRVSGPDGSAYEPVVEYHVGNSKYRCTGTGSGFSPFAVGEKVWVLYKTSQPEAARIDSFFERWLMPLIIGGIGAVFAAGGVSIVRGKSVAEPSPCR